MKAWPRISSLLHQPDRNGNPAMAAVPIRNTQCVTGTLFHSPPILRLLYVAFYGQSRVDHETAHHLHEPSWWMLGPLLLLAALSALGGLIGVFPGGLESGAFHRFLGPVVSTAAAETGGHRGGHLLPYVLMAVTTVIGLAGWFTAHYFYYVKPEQPDLLANRLKG